MEQFDVFISYKNTDKNGRPTRDAAMAEALYRALTQKGIRTFFSKYSIDNAARADYMKMIDHALESASILVAVGTSRANLDSGWVSDEIDAFRAMRNSGNGKKRSIISYRSAGFSPNDLPTGLRSCQSYDNQKSVVLFIEACLKKASGFRKDGHVTNLIYEDTGTSVLSAPDGHPASSQNTTPEHAPPKQGLKVGDVVNGRYKILNSIGRGGSSEVYLASDNRINRTYAVKEIRPNRNMDFGFIQRHLLRESLLIQKLNHPAIPKIYDIINDGESVIIVMDYVEGCDLNQLLSKRGPFHEEQVLDFARQIAKVLVHLHERPTPIIYRDMKPANLILRPDDTLALIDFGTAREYKTGAVGDTVCLGTVGFAAPEQYAGKGQTDARTDIYNLGATLHQLVTGKIRRNRPMRCFPSGRSIRICPAGWNSSLRNAPGMIPAPASNPQRSCWTPSIM